MIDQSSSNIIEQSLHSVIMLIEGQVERSKSMKKSNKPEPVTTSYGKYAFHKLFESICYKIRKARNSVQKFPLLFKMVFQKFLL